MIESAMKTQAIVVSGSEFGHYQSTAIGLGREAGSDPSIVITEEQKLPIPGAGSLCEPMLELKLTPCSDLSCSQAC